MTYPGEIARSDYDAHPGVRWSRLTNLRKSPLHYQHGLMTERPETSALRTGLALHALVFEPETYDSTFVVYRESKSKGSGAKLAWEAFQAANTRIILGADEEERALSCAESIRRAAGHLIAPHLGRGEIPITWTDERTGLLCKARLDWVMHSGLALDLKSCRSAELRAFGRQAWHLGYFHQAVFYMKGLAAVTGSKLAEIPFRFVAVESDEPHDVSIFEPCAETRDAAEIEVNALLDRLTECQRMNTWPGRYEGTQQLSAPAYVLMSDDEEWSVTTGETHAAL